MVVLSELLVEPERGDPNDVTDLLRVPAGAATMTDVMPPVRPVRPPWMPVATEDEEGGGQRRPARTAVSEAALRTILEAAVWKSEAHPRWPKGTPGKGGQFIQVGEKFQSGGKTYEVAHIVKGKIIAHEASAKYGSVETKSFDVKHGDLGGGEHGPHIPGAKYVPPTSVPKGGKSQSSQITIVDPYVDHKSHDPSVPIPAGSSIDAEQWKRFGKVDQEHYTELMERFGQHKPGAAKAHIDASYQAYEAKVQQMVKTGYSSQYGSSSGYSLSMAAGGHVEDTPEMAKLREDALALQAEHRAAVQWDLYNRTLSPDVFAVHKSKSWSAQTWHDHAIKGDKAVFSGLSQSWSYRASFFGSQGVATPLAIRSILLSSHSAQPIPGQSHFPGELEISVPEQMKLDSRSVAFAVPGQTPGGSDVKMLTATQNQWLEGVTNQPMGGHILDMLRDSMQNGTKLPTPPAPAHLVMDSAGGQTWADPPGEAAKVLDAARLPQVQSSNIDPGTLDKDLPWQHVDENGVPNAVTGETAGAKAGQYFMGMKGTLYWIGNDPGVKTGYPFRIHKIVNGSFNGENWAYNPDLPGYYLDAHHAEVLAKPEDAPTFTPSDWVNGTDQQFLEDFEPGDKFKLNGAHYEVDGLHSSGQIKVTDLETGKSGKINGNFKTVKLVPKGSAAADPAEAFKSPVLAEGLHVMTPDGHGVVAAVDGDDVHVDMTHGGHQVMLPESAVSPWAQPMDPAVGHTFPFYDGGEYKKATITVVKGDGSVQVNLAPGKVVIPKDEWPAYADKVFDPGAWNVSQEPVKLRDLQPGDKFQGSAGHQTLRPYEVLSVPEAGQVTVRNMDTGQVTTMSRHKSYRPLEAKPAPGSAAEATQDMPDSPAAPQSTPQSTALHENIDPANLQTNGLLVPASQFKVGDVTGTTEKPYALVVAKDESTGELTVQKLDTGTTLTLPPAEMAPKVLWVPKGDKDPGDLTGGPPAAPSKPFVELDGGKFVEGEVQKLGEMEPGTVFKTTNKHGGETFYKVNDAGTHSVNLKNGKSYPLKGGWKGTVMQPAPTRAEGESGAIDPATFNADDWENAGGSQPFSDVPVGTVYALPDGTSLQKTSDDGGTLLHDPEGVFSAGENLPTAGITKVFPLAPSAGSPTGTETHGQITPASLKDKPGALFEHKGVMMSVAQDQSVAKDDELIAVAPDGKGWLVTPSAGGVTPVPGHGPTKHVNVGDTVVWNGQLATVTDATGAGGDGETPGGHLDLELMNGDTMYAEAAEVTHLPSTTLKPGDLVHAFKPANPASPSLGGDLHTVGHVKQVLANGGVQVEGSVFTYKPEHVESLAAYPFKPWDKVQHVNGVSKGSFVGWDVIDGQPHAAYVNEEGDENHALPHELSLASVPVDEPSGTVLEPKADKVLAHEQLAAGDATTVGALKPGDQFTNPLGKFEVVHEPGTTSDNAKVAWVNADGELGQTTNLYPDAAVTLHAKAADVQAAPAPVEHAVDWETLPDAEGHGFVGYKSHKGSGGKWSHHMVGTMPAGTTFADLNGKQWKVKEAGAKPVITDGEQLFKVNGKLRGKDLNQPAVKQNASLVDNSPPVGWVPPQPVMVPNTQSIEHLGLGAGDQFKVNGSPDVWTAGQADDLGFVTATTVGVSGLTSTVFGPALKPTHVSAAALVKPQQPDAPGSVAPAVAAPPTVHTHPINSGDLAVGQEFKMAPGSTQVMKATDKNALGVGYEVPLDDGTSMAAGMGLGVPVYVEPKPEPVKPPEPSEPAATVVDPASVQTIGSPDQMVPVPPVPADPVVSPAPLPINGFGSRLGPGGVYKHDKLSELQVGQLFTDKTGKDYQLVGSGEGKITYKDLASGKVHAAPSNLRVKRTALPPDPGPQVKQVLTDVVAHHGSLENVPTGAMTGFTSATGEGGAVKYPRLGHLKAGQVVEDADGTPMTFVASWLDKALVWSPGAQGYRLVPAGTRVHIHS